MAKLINYYTEHCLLFSKAERNFVSLLLIAPILIRCVPDFAAEEVQWQKSLQKKPNKPLGSNAAHRYRGNGEVSSEHDYPHS